MPVGLTNSFVEKTCVKLLGKSFLGVYPCDIHPTTKKRTFSIIFNTGDSSTSGEHFVAIYANRGTLYYFDPFGNKPNDVNIKAFISRAIGRRSLNCWNKQIQHDNSTYCGFFCIGYLLHKHKNIKKFKKYFKYNKNLEENNQRIIQFIMQII